MQIMTRAALAAFILLAPAIVTAPAQAKCAGSSALDSCLVGTWREAGGGAVEWMKRNMPAGMPMPQMQTGAQMIVLSGDGTYATAPMTAKATMQEDGAIRAEGTVTASAKRRWSAQDGMLHLCPEVQEFKGAMTVAGPDGKKVTVPIDPGPETAITALRYTCAGDVLETEMSVPGMNDPMVTSYARAKP